MRDYSDVPLIIATAVEISIGTVFICAAALKFLRPEPLRSALAQLRMPWPAAVTPILAVYESVLGVTLITGVVAEIALLVGILTLLVFSVTLAHLNRKGFADNCGCFGSVFGTRLLIPWRQRNALLICVAVMGLVSHSGFEASRAPIRIALGLFGAAAAACGVTVAVTLQERALRKSWVNSTM